MVSKDNKELCNRVDKDKEEIQMVDFLSSEDIIDDYLLFADLLNDEEEKKSKVKLKLHY
ncbi:hypothetical protein BX659_107122 [Orenia metallireducens]|jgi:hypothetical protein|uniref:Uncharacterized protein n=1 Tax=Orenia metallireducens TaxID=1413210 RepID=A0A285GJX9_9FIRM|nr:hypothetical protein BX659_107122 [Orenia metallireducens]SNY22796.1 hypothetical protein SAMN06265827_107122 [Orenia metallireducens]